MPAPMALIWPPDDLETAKSEGCRSDPETGISDCR